MEQRVEQIQRETGDGPLSPLGDKGPFTVSLPQVEPDLSPQGDKGPSPVSLEEDKHHQARQFSPLTLAFMGDAVYEREIRERVVLAGNTTPAKLNKKSSALSKAATQAQLAHLLEPYLSEEEADVLRRGRNANSHTMAKNATMADYRAATGLEALFGYLYLCGEEKRGKDLLNIGLSLLPEEALRSDRNR